MPRNLLFELLSTAGVVSATMQPCPFLPPTSFVLPSPFANLREIEGGMYEYNYGVQVTDINGDSLPDILWGWEDEFDSGGNTWLCVYLNTQCGWVLQANYTGPVSSCMPSNMITVRDVDFFWYSKDTVGTFMDDIADEFGIKDRSSLWLQSVTTGRRYAKRNLMSDAVSQGLSVRIAGEAVPVEVH